MAKDEIVGKKLDFGAPVGMINSARVLLHRADRSTVILRQGKGGLFGLVGGKVHVFEHSRNAAEREVREETGLELSGSLRHEGVLKMAQRTIWYPVSKFKELGFAFPHQAEDADLIQMWNPRAELYSGVALGEISSKLIEGREVIQLDLRDKASLEKIKPRHRKVLKAWRDFVLDGSPFPNQFVWEQP